VALETPDRPDLVIDLTTPGALDDFQKKPFKIKAGSTLQMRIRFRVQREILSGLKYEQTAKRDGNVLLKLFKPPPIKEMIGSFGPSTQKNPFYEFRCRCLCRSGRL
jgi:Rho GDP-dissociation inhibitor